MDKHEDVSDSPMFPPRCSRSVCEVFSLCGSVRGLTCPWISQGQGLEPRPLPTSQSRSFTNRAMEVLPEVTPSPEWLRQE